MRRGARGRKEASSCMVPSSSVAVALFMTNSDRLGAALTRTTRCDLSNTRSSGNHLCSYMRGPTETVPQPQQPKIKSKVVTKCKTPNSTARRTE